MLCLFHDRTQDACPHINMMPDITISAILLMLSTVTKISCSGVFEVKILALYNNRGQTHDGQCCGSSHTSPDCPEQCQTFFYVCLRHNSSHIPSNPSCTFGSATTTVIGGNNVQETDDSVKMSFTFPWPQSFALVIEAWHDADGNRSTHDRQNVIMRVSKFGSIAPSLVWQTENSNTPTTELRFKYRLTCDANHYGHKCSQWCLERDDSFGHYICSENGTRTCVYGWEGDFCDKAMCSEKCNQSHGICQRPFECQCRIGYHGENCDQCIRYTNCLHGYCKQPWQCICDNGWGGPLCDIDLNFCMKQQPCDNGGICNKSPAGNYTCTCAEGYDGTNCEQVTCYHGYCLNNGACQTRGMERDCDCEPGFYGDRCQFLEVICLLPFCRNGGSCQENGISGRCICPRGFTGATCEIEINECVSDPCKNGGTCRDGVGEYYCSCADGYAGKNCNRYRDPCIGITCFNGGTCKSIYGRFIGKCLCRPDFTGHRCERPVDLCSNFKCLHGGMCKNSPTNNGFYCQCSLGYVGEFCETKVNLCESEPCRNGGTCSSYSDYFLCICTYEYKGQTCESFVMNSNEINQIRTTPLHKFVEINSVSGLHAMQFTRTLLLCYMAYLLKYLTVNRQLFEFCFIW